MFFIKYTFIRIIIRSYLYILKLIRTNILTVLSMEHSTMAIYQIEYVIKYNLLIYLEF